MNQPGSPKLGAQDLRPAAASFLAAHGLADAQLDAFVADASSRRYYRVLRHDLLLMDDRYDPKGFAAFILIASHLNGLGLSAPRLLQVDRAEGLALVEDFGDATYANCLACGHDEGDLYELAVDALLKLHHMPQGGRIDLPAYDMHVHLDELSTFSQWFAPAVCPDLDVAAFDAAFRSLWQDALGPVATRHETLVLRDFHVDNLMLLANRRGVARCGLLDFQDALRGPCEYDLLSLLQDARRDLAAGLEERLLDHYCANAPEMLGDASAIRARYYILGAQRHARILGVFVRLCQRDAKPRYLAFLPRVLAQFRTALHAPGLDLPMSDTLLPSYYLAPTYLPTEGPRHDVTDPATLEHVGTYGEPTAGQIEEMLDRVNAAQTVWAGMDCKSRAKILHGIADAMEQADMTDIAVMMAREIGKPYPEAIGEIANIPAVFRYYAEMARDDAGKIAGSMEPGSFQYQTYVPQGVSVHIVPYNFPLILGCWTIAASLAAGNGVVLKAAPVGTICTLMFMKFFDGLPPDLIACVGGGVEIGTQLIESKKTHVIAFTGSAEVGRHVAVEAARHMKPCVIEGGGSDPLVVSRHADIKVAAAATVTAAFLQSGQVCTSTERVYVEDAVHDDFVAALVERTQQLRVGNPLEVAEIGPLVSEAAQTRVLDWIESARNAGATIALGGSVPQGKGKGWFVEPTIVTGVTNDMALFEREIFGPVVSIVRVASFAEGLTQANQSTFGLGAAVFTADLAEAHQAIDALEAGMVWVNNPLVDNDALPFGGVKNSGLGRALGRIGLDAFRSPKMVVLNPVAKEADWWYPYPDDWFLDGGGRKHI